MNLQKLIPIAIIPAAIALLAGCLSYRILPLGSIPYAVAMVAVALAAFGSYDRVRYADESDETFTKRIALAYFWVIPAALVGWLISQVLWINPPWPALLGVAIAIYKARGYLARDDSASPKTEEVIRGPVLESFDDIRKQSETLATARNHGLVWGGVSMPNDAARSHFLVCGTTGSGKTKTIQLLMETVLRRVKPKSDVRALVYDAKGDMAQYLAALNLQCPIHILNIFDQRGTAWDIAADLTSREDAEELATSLCPVSGNERDPFYPQATRALVSSLIETLSQRAPGQWTLRDVINAANLKTQQLKKLLGLFPEIEHLLYTVFEAKELPSVRVSVSTALRKYSGLAGAWHATLNQGRKISLNEWLDDESVLLLPSRRDYSSLIAPLNQLIVRHLASRILVGSETETRQTWLFLDELRGLGYIPDIPDLLAEGRSKGLCAVIGFQELSGLQNPDLGYGEYETDRIIGQCNSVAFLRSKDVKTAEWASKMLMEHERIVTLTSRSTSRGTVTDGENQQISQVPLVLPSEIQNLHLCDRQSGLSGYYSSGCFRGPWKATLSPEFITGSISKPDMKVPAFLKHEHSYACSPWDAEDLKRLNLEFLTEDGDGRAPVEPPSPPKPGPQPNSNWQIPRIRRPPNAPPDNTGRP